MKRSPFLASIQTLIGRADLDSQEAVPYCSPKASKQRLARHCARYLVAAGWKVEKGAFGGDLAITKPGRVFHLVFVGADFMQTEIFIRDCSEIRSKLPLALVIVSILPLPDAYKQLVKERYMSVLHYLELPQLSDEEGLQMLRESVPPKITSAVNETPGQSQVAKEPSSGSGALSEQNSMRGARRSLQSKLPGVIAFLCKEKRFEDAYAVADAAEIAYPSNHTIQLQGAMAALLAGAYDIAHERYTICRERFPSCEEGYSYGGMALRRMRRVSEAEVLLKDGIERFPNAWRMYVELAECISSSRISDKVEQWSNINSRFQNVPESYWRLTHELLILGDIDRAEEVIGRGYERFPTDRYILWQYAEVATRRRLWAEADKRWSAALKLHPEMRELKYGYGEMKLAASLYLSDASEEVPAEPVVEPAVESPDELGAAQLALPDLASCFEGLGDNCEFGLVQRSFGVEPLGLLRWSNIAPSRLRDLLASRFEGVGEPQFTALDLSRSTGEYFLRDTRYFGMHTFIKAGQGDAEQIRVQMQRRLKFLVRKLVEDLEEGQKIFLYKSIDCDITVAQAEEIKIEIAKYGPGKLLCVRRPWSGANNRDVTEVSEGIFFGFLGSLTANPLSVGSYIDDWTAVLRDAYAKASVSDGKTLGGGPIGRQ